MKDLLNKLKELQEIDTNFLRVQRSIKAGPVEEQSAREKLDSCQKILEEKEAEFKQEQVDADAKNLDLKNIEAEIAKLKEKMNTVKNNKEYTIVKEAMSSVNNRKEEIESALLQQMEKTDAIKAELEKIQAEAATAQEELNKIQEEVEGQIKELKEEAVKLREKRAICMQGIDKETLEDYEATLRASKGIAVVPMLNGACQGCYRNVAQNTAVKVRVGAEVTKCRECGRFLYNPESEEETPAE